MSLGSESQSLGKTHLVTKFHNINANTREHFGGQSSPVTRSPVAEDPSPCGHVKRQVDRLAEDLAQISASLSGLGRELQPEQGASARNLLHAADEAAVVREMITARRRRSRFFPSEIFADPAWDILLDLYLAEIEQRRIMISNLCVAADVPPTTALRWITTLIERGLISRKPDKLDRRRVHVELTQSTSDGMRFYFEFDKN